VRSSPNGIAATGQPSLRAIGRYQYRPARRIRGRRSRPQFLVQHICQISLKVTSCRLSRSRRPRLDLPDIALVMPVFWRGAAAPLGQKNARARSLNN
jgi:hypothetical protein